MKPRFYLTAVLAASAFIFSTAAEARKGVNGLHDLMAEYLDHPVDELIQLIGYPKKQEPVLDRFVLEGGFDSDVGESCQWWITIDSNRVIKEVRVFGNDWGCGNLRKRAEKLRTEKSKS